MPSCDEMASDSSSMVMALSPSPFVVELKQHISLVAQLPGQFRAIACLQTEGERVVEVGLDVCPLSPMTPRTGLHSHIGVNVDLQNRLDVQA